MNITAFSIKNIIFILVVLTGVTACSDVKDYSSHFHNYIQLSVQGNSALNEDDTFPIKVNILLANTPQQDVSVLLELNGNNNEVLRLEQPRIDFKAGEKTAQVEIYSNQKGILNQQQVVTLKVKSYTDNNMEAWNEQDIIVKPNKEIPELTEEQKLLLDGYKAKWGLDLSQFMGKLKCSTTITFNSGDYGNLYDDKDVKTYEGNSIITLSPKATAERPMIKIISNPLGMNSFLWEMMRRCTVENPIWNDNENNPEPIAILKAINYNNSNEVFEVSLDELEIVPSEQNIKFIKPVMTSPANEEFGTEATWLNVIPFDYHFSAWERFKEMAEANVSYQFKEGDQEIEKSLKEAPESYQLNPTYHLTYSSLDTDGWDDETIYIKPSASYDTNKGTLNFSFPWDCQISSGGYTIIRVTYYLNPISTNNQE